MNTDKFINSVVAVVIGVIIVTAVAIPVITSNQVASTVTNYAAMNTIMNILPLMMLIGLLVAAVFFVKAKKG